MNGAELFARRLLAFRFYAASGIWMRKVLLSSYKAKGLQQRTGVGGADLLRKKDVHQWRAGRHEDGNQTVASEVVHPTWRLYEAEAAPEPRGSPEVWVEGRSDRRQGIQVCGCEDA